MTAPRDDLIRMVPLERANVSADGNTLVGYAAVFNDWTDIDSWEGTFRERMDPKAFDKTLSENAQRIKVLFNHGMDPQIGDKPLGKPSVMEPRRKGLWVETPLDETSYNADLKASLASGALDGMSIRFSVTREEWADGDDGIEERTIKEAKLYEFGPVTFPAYEATTAGVRNAGAFKVWKERALTTGGVDSGAGLAKPDDASLETIDGLMSHLSADNPDGHYWQDSSNEGMSLGYLNQQHEKFHASGAQHSHAGIASLASKPDAVSSDRSTPPGAAASDRDTSALETWKARALLLRQDVERQRKENEKWLAPQN